MTNKYSYNELLRKTYLSYELLKKLFEEEITTENDRIFMDGEPFKISQKELLLITQKGIKKRRKDKSTFDYLNFFDNKEQQNYVIDVFFEVNDKLDCINICQKGNFFVYQLLGNNKEIILQKSFKDNFRNNNTLLICSYYEIV